MIKKILYSLLIGLFFMSNQLSAKSEDCSGKVTQGFYLTTLKRGVIDPFDNVKIVQGQAVSRLRPGKSYDFPVTLKKVQSDQYQHFECNILLKAKKAKVTALFSDGDHKVAVKKEVLTQGWNALCFTLPKFTAALKEVTVEVEYSKSEGDLYFNEPRLTQRK